MRAAWLLALTCCMTCGNPTCDSVSSTLATPIAADFGVAPDDELVLPALDAKFPIYRITIEMWIRPRSLQSDRIETILCSKDYDDKSVMLLLFDGHLAVHVFANKPRTLRFTGLRLPVNEWTHIAVVYDAPWRQLELYVNGTVHQAPCEAGLLGGLMDGSKLTSDVTEAAKHCKFVETAEQIPLGASQVGDCSNGQLDAYIKELRLWSEKRNAQLIKENYKCALDPAAHPYQLTGVPAVDAMHSMSVAGVLAIYPLAGDTRDVSGRKRDASGQVRWAEGEAMIVPSLQQGKPANVAGNTSKPGGSSALEGELECQMIKKSIQWTDWSPCSSECGGGSQWRVQKPKLDEHGTEVKCDGVEAGIRTIQVCNKQPCALPAPAATQAQAQGHGVDDDLVKEVRLYAARVHTGSAKGVGAAPGVLDGEEEQGGQGMASLQTVTAYAAATLLVFALGNLIRKRVYNGAQTGRRARQRLDREVSSEVWSLTLPKRAPDSTGSWLQGSWSDVVDEGKEGNEGIGMVRIGSRGGQDSGLEEFADLEDEADVL